MTQPVKVWTPATLLALEYTEEQQRLIDKEVLFNTEGTCHRLQCHWSDALEEENGLAYAVFGERRHELVDFSDIEDALGTRFECLPVIVEGRMLEKSCHDGHSGVLYLMRCTHDEGRPVVDSWRTSFIGFDKTCRLNPNTCHTFQAPPLRSLQQF